MATCSPNACREIPSLCKVPSLIEGIRGIQPQCVKSNQVIELCFLGYGHSRIVSSADVRYQIFDSDDFTEVLRAAISEGYEAVFNLTKMCIIRMSLVKGWGEAYGRPTVTCTPCWIEIYLDGPLKWIDTVLLTMRGPTESINSVS